jgi:TetR/AcrR family transcriptional regulator
MPGLANTLAPPPQYRRNLEPRPRSEAKRSRIIDASMKHFAEHGYHEARVGDIATQLSIAKGSIFQHFGSKDGLFFEVYMKAVRSFPAYLDCPSDVKMKGFWEIMRYWLQRTENMLRDNWIPYRIYLIGNYGTDLVLRREINRFLVSEDPYGWGAFVRFGVKRGELRSDIDIEMIVSILEWTMDRFQDALLTEELDPGLFRRQGDAGEKREARINQFLDLLKRAIGASVAA